MALDRTDRYASVTELAADVRRWIADEPVSAYPEPLPARARRWTRHHRTLTTAAAASALVGMAALGIVYRRETGYSGRLDRINSTLDEANNRLTQANHDLDGRNKELDHQKKRAEMREALAIDAVNKFRDAVATNTQLKSRPELESLRKTLLKEPLEFFRKLREQLKADSSTEPKAIHSLATATHFAPHARRGAIGSIRTRSSLTPRPLHCWSRWCVRTQRSTCARSSLREARTTSGS